MKPKHTSLAFLLFAASLCAPRAQAQYIVNYAGNGYAAGTGSGGRLGDGGQATMAQLSNPTGVANYGYINVYVADNGNHVVRKIDHDGIISTLAGNDQVGFTFGGDSTAAINTKLSNPYAVAVDSANNVFFSDYTNNVVYKVNNYGIISVVAGNDTAGYSGDGDIATNARLDHPLGIALDRYDNLYIADAQNNVIRRVDAASGIITTVAGNGYGHGLSLGHGSYTGDNGLAVGATLNYPSGVAVDIFNNIYIADASNNVIRKVTAATGNITTLAGTGIPAFGGDGGSAAAASFVFPAGVAVDGPGNVYIADQGNNNVRKITTDGKIATIAGNHAAGYDPGNHNAVTSQLNAPSAIAVDGSGLVYVADSRNNVIRLLGPASIVTAVQSVNELAGTVKLYPNPSTGNFTIELPATNEAATIMVTDMLGKLVATRTMADTKAQQVSFDLSGFAAGTYLVKISAAGNVYREKLQLIAK